MEHQILQNAVTDLSTKFDALTAQESELNTRIVETPKLYMYNRNPPRPVLNFLTENLML